MLLSPGLSWPDPLQGLNNLKIHPLSDLWCSKSCTYIRQSGHSQSGWCPNRLETSSEACSALSLKPRQDYLSNFPLFFSCSVMFRSSQPHGLKQASLPCPSLSPSVCSNSCPLSWWCHPFHLLSSPSPPAFSLSQHKGLCQWVGSSHQVAKVLGLQLQYQSFQWIFLADFL